MPDQPTDEQLFAAKLDKIRQAAKPPKVLPADKLVSEGEAKSLHDKQLKDQRVRAAKLRNDSMQDDIEARKEVAHRLFCLMAMWLFGIFMLILGDGASREVEISENVLLATIGGTTVNILGLFYIVVNYLFPQKKK